MFIGEKLNQIRMLYGFSRNELAKELDVSEQAIWQYEQSIIQPRFETLIKINNLFGLDSKYLFSKNLLNTLVSEGNIAYRNGDREQRSKTISEATYIDFVHMILGQFALRVNLFDLKVKSIREKIQKETNAFLTEEKIEKAAYIARKELGITDNRNLITCLEKSGIIILEKRLTNYTDAYSTWVEDVPYIILGNYQKSFVRRNFDLAHELGHLLIHYKKDITCLPKEEFNQVEKEADSFAAHFLLPRREFLDDLECIGTISNPNHYIELKRKWSVSIVAMGYRAHSLKKMTYQQNRYFYASMNKYNYRVIEPLDKELTIIRPSKIKSLFKFLFENKVITLKEILETYKIKIKCLSFIFNIQEDFFKQYLNEEEVSSMTFEFNINYISR